MKKALGLILIAAIWMALGLTFGFLGWKGIAALVSLALAGAAFLGIQTTLVSTVSFAGAFAIVILALQYFPPVMKMVFRRPDEIVTQFSSAILARFHVVFDITREPRQMRVDLFPIRWVADACAVAADAHAEHARFFHRGTRQFATAPFPTIEDETGSIDGIGTPERRIVALPLSEAWRREAVGPAEAIPVVHMKGDRHELAP